MYLCKEVYDVFKGTVSNMLKKRCQLQLTDWKHERLNTPTSQENTWTPILNFIEIYM